MKIAILGAGLTGLALGRRLKISGKEFVILEKEPRAGGICRTNQTHEYRWDFGVHAIYSKSQQARDYFNSLPLDYNRLNRNTKIFHTGSDGKKYIIGYPFEMGIRDLPAKDKFESINGYLNASRKKNYSSLLDWINRFSGPGIAKHFMIPYNKKIWNCGLSEISSLLVSSKIHPAPKKEFLSSVFGKKVIGRAYQAKFIYPKYGIQELTDYYANDLKNNIILDSGVKKLTRQRNKWLIITDNDKRIEAESIISTIPLVELLKKIDVPGVEKRYRILRWNNTYFVMLGLKQKENFRLIKKCHWAFFKEKEIFYRLTLMHNFSPRLPPAAVAEITQKGDVLRMTEKEIRTSTISGMMRTGIVEKKQIAETDIKLLPYTYPIPTVGMEKVKARIAYKLAKYNLFLLGRNGNWDYINMDGVILNVNKFCEDKAEKI